MVISVQCHKVECAFTSPVRTECGMIVMCCMQCFVVCGCAVTRRYVDVCYCDMFSVVNVYLDDLKFCVFMVEGMSVVVNIMLSLMSVMSLPPAMCNLSLHTVVKLCTLFFYFRGELRFLNCDDVCMCVVSKQFELLEFVSESVYVDLQYDEISLTFTAGYVCLCGVCSPVVVLGLSVRLLWYSMSLVRLLR